MPPLKVDFGKVLKRGNFFEEFTGEHFCSKVRVKFMV